LQVESKKKKKAIFVFFLQTRATPRIASRICYKKMAVIALLVACPALSLLVMPFLYVGLKPLLEGH
jgi:hypothetical protein